MNSDVVLSPPGSGCTGISGKHKREKGEHRTRTEGQYMHYRTIRKSGEKIPTLGLGCMRLERTPDGKIDEGAAITMVRHAIRSGVSYIDSAWIYHDGDNEAVGGKALEGGWKENAFLVTKLPSWEVTSREEMDEYLTKQLHRLGTDYLDAYFLHPLSKDRWDNLVSLGVINFFNQAKKDGKIRYAGFSFHDTFEAFQEIIDAYDWDLCQIQYNYLDEECQAGTKGLKYASSRNVSVIVMEPLRGGLLSKDLPTKAIRLLDAAPVQWTPSEWGLRWVWDNPDVTGVLSGMTSEGQLEENCRTAEISMPYSLSPYEHAVVQQVRHVFNEAIHVPCTRCGYCMPCPSGVNIPECLAQLKNTSISGDVEYARFFYDGLLIESGYASLCVQCGACEERCPQNIRIRDYVHEASALFGR